MQITSDSFAPGAPIPPEFAFGRIPDDPSERFATSANRSPHLAWEGAPADTRSYVILCIDEDVPSRPDDVNQEGRTVPHDLPRTSFVHWTIVDIPADVRELAAGACSDGVVAGGKQDPPGPPGARQGRNDYTSWFDGDPDMGGTYLGYDGPCPPWNDERLHRYDFRIFAVDVERLDVDGAFTADEVQAAMEGHVLATATLTGTYTMNRDLA